VGCASNHGRIWAWRDHQEVTVELKTGEVGWRQSD
jgi:hypothetical protein